MALNWHFDSNDFVEKDFTPVPEGDHRVRICDAVEKTFRSGNSGVEVTLEVSNYRSKLWHYIVIDPSDKQKTNQRIGSFFESFGIVDNDLSHYPNWVGKVGGVRVRNEEYNGNLSPKVAFCLSKKNQERLPAAQFGNAAPTAASANMVDFSDLPFEM